MTVYATPDDLATSGLPPKALANIDEPTLVKALTRASAYADSYIGDKYTLPLLVPYDAALVDAVCQIAAWRLLCLRGFNPDNPGDAVIRQGFEDATKWLTRVANGQARLQVVQSAPASNQPDVATNQPRGYGNLFGIDEANNDPAVGGGWGGFGV